MRAVRLAFRQRDASDDPIGRLVRREFSAALMSDTKWRKLFTLLSRHRETSGLMLSIKFVDQAEARRMRVPSQAAFRCPRPYLETNEFSVIELRAIEWIDIPHAVSVSRGSGLEPWRATQKIDAIPALLGRLGKFPIGETDDGLRIDGYAR